MGKHFAIKFIINRAEKSELTVTTVGFLLNAIELDVPEFLQLQSLVQEDHKL